MKIRELASGLLFPEGPIAMDDGSVILVEIGRGTLTRVARRTLYFAETDGARLWAYDERDGARARTELQRVTWLASYLMTGLVAGSDAGPDRFPLFHVAPMLRQGRQL